MSDTPVDGRRGPRDAPSGTHEPLLTVRGLAVHFPLRAGLLGRRAGALRAVDGVSLEVRRGETLGLVGESGCGKSTTGRALLRLVEATEGEIRFGDIDVRALSGASLRTFRRRAQIVFQDPFSSLNPRMSVGQMLREVLDVHRLEPSAEARGRRVRELLEQVGLGPEHLNRYPHEFSGGQRQRLGIARALAVEPEFLVLDEPVSALDVSVQAQVVNLLRGLQERLGLAYLFIAHDLGLVRHVSDRVAVMYLGRIVETAPAEMLYRAPRHPYTTSLLASVPRVRVRAGSLPRPRILLEGDVPSPVAPPTGCPFHPRCPHPGKDEQCRVAVPILTEGPSGHWAACHKDPIAG